MTSGGRMVKELDLWMVILSFSCGVSSVPHECAVNAQQLFSPNTHDIKVGIPRIHVPYPYSLAQPTVTSQGSLLLQHLANSLPLNNSPLAVHLMAISSHVQQTIYVGYKTRNNGGREDKSSAPCHADHPLSSLSFRPI